MSPAISGGRNALLDALETALGIDRRYVQRVVIDIDTTTAVKVHVQMLGDDSIIDVVKTLAGVEIQRVEGAKPAPEALAPENVAQALEAEANDEAARPTRDEGSRRVEGDLRRAARIVRDYLGEHGAKPAPEACVTGCGLPRGHRSPHAASLPPEGVVAYFQDEDEEHPPGDRSELY